MKRSPLVSKAWNSMIVKTIKSGFLKANIIKESENVNNEIENSFLNLFNSESDNSNFDGFE